MSAAEPVSKKALFLDAVRRFNNAAVDLEQAWSALELEAPGTEIGVKAYPFGKDFTDVVTDVMTWHESIENEVRS